MISSTHPTIDIQGASTNNLKHISLSIPHHQFIVVTGVSGSGKSSLVFELIAQEGQRRYFETLPSFSRQFMGKLNRPQADAIHGLSPVIAIGQRTTGMHARSTVGTLSDIYDLLRLLFARTGASTQAIELSRALFSFNSATGKCPHCNGIGKKEEIDLKRLIISPEKSIRAGALAPTLPTGYIMYSQVTIDVLNQVCEAEGFSVDIAWNELSEQERHVILYGSDKIKVPFGKHSLESRLKWTGIKAKPREEGYYKGMIPIMSDILKRDRNANILKYVHAITCPVCQGARLNSDALSVRVKDKSIADVSRLEINELKAWIQSNKWDTVGATITNKIEAQLDILIDLGLGHLTLDRPSASLRASEIQRIRLANQILMPLSNVLYVFDEPSIGLSPQENERLISHFKELVKKGNTLIVVEHDLATIQQADHIIEIGPAAGTQGGEVLFNGSFSDFIQNQKLLEISPTYKALKSVDVLNTELSTANASISLWGCYERNLKHIDVHFQLGQLNIVSGNSGAGKSSLVKGTLLKLIQAHLNTELADKTIKLSSYENIAAINKLIFIDHSPIGKTPRSNPATYLGLSNHIRDLFASLPVSKAQGFTKSRFSFNNKGGRCETCQGAGKTQIGMHFLGHVDLVCSSCNGERFNAETLAITYKGLSIADCYQLSIKEAIDFFADQKKIMASLTLLQEIGLGYLKLGQSSTTLSGGEAQRIKIANQLQKKDTGDTLYIIIEPSIGLHHNDVKTLLQLFQRIKQKGNTIVCIEQNESLIQASDWHIELGPHSGASGGSIVHQGKPKTGIAKTEKPAKKSTSLSSKHQEIRLYGVRTHGLKNVDVRIPKNQLTVVTGRSGSGKSSLVYGTIFAEANARFTASLSTYNRSFLQQNSEAKIDQSSGLGPVIGINRKGGAASKRSTVGTLSGIYDALRLLYSRIAQHEGANYSAQHFSFNHHLGACASCEGLGIQTQCDPDKVILTAQQSIFEGAISSNKAIAYYADPDGQFMATLSAAAKHNNWDIDRPWQSLNKEVQQAILYGTGDKLWEADWVFKTKSRTGTQALNTKYLGLCNYINEEYARKRHNKNIKALEDLLHNVSCDSCNGSRLKSHLLSTTFLGKNIHELTQLSITAALDVLEHLEEVTDPTILAISERVLPSARASLQTLVELGLGHLHLNRAVSSLSGGEQQRLRLASQLSTQLFGVTYILDEPTIGLDAQQVAVLSQLLKRIVAHGNTVVVVEHDVSFIKSADYLIEMGPAAGKAGGQVVYQGKLTDIAQAKQSLTYQLLHKNTAFTHKKENPKALPFGVKAAYANNLKQIDVDFHAAQIIAVTGVSGSGKSSLVKEVLYRSYLQNKAVNCNAVYGLEQFSKVLLIDQEILKQNRLSTPASYTGLLNHLKILFAKTADALALGFKRADFSYQSKKGKCPICNGYGEVKTSMDFMSDLWLECDSCKGLRYHPDILACLYKGRSIGQILQMSVQEAIDFFDTESIIKELEVLQQLGLSHLILGQSGNSLSGGEAQRLKLAHSLMQKRTGNTLYLFDEPSTGLHHFDILELIEVFQSIIDRGDTVLFIEHNESLIAAADRIITLGPASGDAGGALV